MSAPIYNESFAAYQASGCIGVHKLNDFRDRGAHFYRLRYVTREIEPEAPTAALNFGSYFDCATLEPDLLASRFVVEPNFDRRTKEGKAQFAAFRDANAGKAFVSEEEAAAGAAMAKAVLGKRVAADLFKRGRAQVTFRHEVAGLFLQCRADWFDETRDEWGRPTIVDLKTIDEIQNFSRQFFKFDYYRQAAFYQLVVQAALGLDFHPRFLFCVVEKAKPYQVGVYQPDEAALDIGRRECLADLARLRECFEKDTWPGTPDEIAPVSLPAWKEAAA